MAGFFLHGQDMIREHSLVVSFGDASFRRHLLMCKKSQELHLHVWKMNTSFYSFK